MPSPTEKQAANRVAELLRTWFDKPAVGVCRDGTMGSSPIDVVIDACGHSFAGKYKASSDAASVAMAIDHLREFTQREKALTPLLLVPYMGNVGAKRCREAGALL